MLDAARRSTSTVLAIVACASATMGCVAAPRAHICQVEPSQPRSLNADDGQLLVRGPCPDATPNGRAQFLAVANKIAETMYGPRATSLVSVDPLVVDNEPYARGWIANSSVDRATGERISIVCEFDPSLGICEYSFQRRPAQFD